MLLHFLQRTVSMQNNIVRISVSFLCTFFVSAFFLLLLFFILKLKHIKMCLLPLTTHLIEWHFLHFPASVDNIPSFLLYTDGDWVYRINCIYCRPLIKCIHRQSAVSIIFNTNFTKWNNFKNIVTFVSAESWNTSRLIDNHGRIDTDFFPSFFRSFFSTNRRNSVQT